MWVNIKCGLHNICAILHQKTILPLRVRHHGIWFTSSGRREKARPHDEVILVTGDGSLMMNIQELGSIKRGKLPVKILLLDNQRLAWCVNGKTFSGTNAVLKPF